MLTLLTVIALSVSAIGYIAVSLLIRRRTTTLADHLPLTDDDERAATVNNPTEFSASTVATTISLATVILAYAELASWAGLWLLWTVITTAIGVFAIRLAAPRIWTAVRRTGKFHHTLHGFLGDSYGSEPLTRIAAVCTSLGFLGALAVELSVGSRFLASLAPAIPLWVATVMIASVGVIYTALGGFRAVIVTDRVQMTAIWISIIALFLLISGSIANLGGWSAFVGKAPPPLYDFSGRDGLTAFLIGIAIINIPTYVADMSVWQRIAASKHKQTVRAGLARSVVSVSTSWAALALIACALVPLSISKEGENPLLTYIASMSNGATMWIAFLLVLTLVGLYAATLSTASTQLIAAGHALHVDVLRPKLGDGGQSGKNDLKLARKLLVFAAVFSLFVVEGLRALNFNIADMVFAVYGAQLGMVPPVILALGSSTGDLKRYRTSALVAITAGFFFGWASAVVGKVMGSENLVFLAPAVSLFVSAIAMAPTFFKGRAK
jgi:Na+/proline symporter